MGILSLGFLLFIHIKNDMGTEQKAWYFHASYVCGIVMLIATILFLYYWNSLKKTGLTKTDYFKRLPAE
jgi:hypothetical protein